MSPSQPSRDAGQAGDGAQPARPSWRGKSGGQPNVARHRWQKDWGRQELDDASRRNRKHRIKVAAVWLLFLGLTLWLVYLFFYDPRQAPFVPVAVTDYDFPLPPNAWAREDVERFNDLQGVTLAITTGSGNPDRDLNLPWRNVHTGINRLDALLEEAAGKASRKQVIIVYVSAHGVVDLDESGRPRPCLLPPRATAASNKDWLPVADLLGLLRDKPQLQGRKVLLLLDAHRIDANWSFGQLVGGFADLLPEVVQQAAAPNLVVLAAADAGQPAWASPEREASIFGHSVWRAFHGDADDGAAGNGDGYIALGELESFVASRVASWSRVNRADVQQPTLLAAAPATLDAARSWTLALVPHSGWFARRSEPASTDEDGTTAADASDMPIEEDAVARLWREHASLEASRAYRYDPLTFQEFQRRLLWLEELIVAGKDYRQAAAENERILAELAQDLRPASRLKENPAANFQLAAALDENFRQSPEAEALWDEAQRQPSREQLARVSSELEPLARAVRADGNLLEVHFLRLVQRYAEPTVWQNTSLLQQVLDVRRRAERVAAPRDPRVHYWTGGPIDRGDQRRRQGEDRLFIGGPSELAAAQGDFDDAAARYAQAGALAEAAARAIALRDRVWAEAPYLAQWLAARLPAALPTQQRIDLADRRDQLLTEHWLPLVRGMQGFSADVLDQPPGREASDAAVDERLAVLQRDAGVLEEHFQTLEEAFRRECADLTELGGGQRQLDPQLLRRIGGVLSVPLVDPGLRERLRQNYRDISQALHVRSLSADAPERVAESAAQPGRSPQLERIGGWGSGNHPAIALTNAVLPEEDRLAVPQSGSPLAQLAQQGDALRRMVASGGSDVQRVAARLADNTLRQLREATTTTPAARRRDMSRADELLRATATLRPRVSRSDARSGPVPQLQALDLQELLLWHARRTLDDFYGSPSGASPFFAEAAQRYLDAAQELQMQIVGSDIAPPAERSLLEARRAAAAKFVELHDVGELAGTEQGDVPHRVAAHVAADLPPGQAALFLRHGNAPSQRVALLDKSPQKRAAFLSLTTGDEGASALQSHQYFIRQGELAVAEEADLRLDAVVFFRGHLQAQAVPTGAVDIAFNPPPYVEPRVKVIREGVGRGEAMFIFDCSASMEQATPLGSRLDVARAALLGREPIEGVFKRLADAGLYHVGLRIYGHRVGWNPANVNQVRWREDEILKLFPETVNRDAYLRELRQVRPGNDTDRVLPISEFTGKELAEVSRLLHKLRPWGITPLFLSVVQSVQNDFQRGTDASHRRIIVITDGKDEQAQDTDLPPQLRATQQDVFDAFDAHNRTRRTEPIQLDVVGFQLDEARELEQIASRTGGRFYPATQPQQLIQQLEKSLGLSNFVLVTESGDEIGPGDFGKWLLVDPPPRRRQPYTVRVLNERNPAETEIELEGGEAIELELSSDGRRLEHRRYDADLRQYAQRVRDPDLRSEGREFFIATHQPPTRLGSEVRFPISIQSQDETRFCPRPAEAWVEIRPVLPAGAGPPPVYTFFDRYFEPQRPVPVLIYEVPRWPTEAVEAEIRLWCKLFPSEPNREVTVGEVADRELPEAQRTVPGADGVAFSVATQATGEPGDEPELQVVVTVRHAQVPGENDALKVEMDPAPSGVLHRYFDSNRLAKHYFRFEGVSREQLREYRIRFTTSERIKQGAIHPERPLIVRVPAS